MYQSYKAWVGNYKKDSPEHIGTILGGINERHEEIISVTAVGLDNVWVIIITKSPSTGWLE